MHEHNLVAALRLPNNLFEESGTSVGTDLIVLQKNTQPRSLSMRARDFMGTTENCNLLFYNPNHIIATSSFQDTDQYGKPTTVHVHDGGVAGIAKDVHLTLSEAFLQYFNRELYDEHSMKEVVNKLTSERILNTPVSVNPDASNSEIVIQLSLFPIRLLMTYRLKRQRKVEKAQAKVRLQIFSSSCPF